MNIDFFAMVLKELGHPIRLNIFRLLVKAGFDGLSVGQLVEELNIPNSTLTHHLAALIKSNLIEQRREGRTLYCVAKFETLNVLIAFLQEECCDGNSC